MGESVVLPIATITISEGAVVCCGGGGEGE